MERAEKAKDAIEPIETTAGPMVEVTYVCAERGCDGEDKMKLFPTEDIPLAINCYKCHGGVGASVADMMRSGRGMRVKKATENKPN